jgi:LacI family transcriptional regulator
MQQQRDISQVGPDRRGWPRIVVAGIKEGPQAQRILELSRELEWQLVDVDNYRGELPPGLEPQGALTTLLPSDDLVKALLARRCPVVRLGHLPHPEDNLVPAVMEDRRAFGRLAADHFSERGFRHVAYRAHLPWSDGKAIYEGFRTRAVELGMTPHLLRVGQRLEESRALKLESRRGETISWLRNLPKPVGFLAYADAMAVRVATWCAKAGIDVPQDVAVLGIHNYPFVCESAVITISSIATDTVRLAECAVELLQELMSGEPRPETTVLIPPKGVVVRESTDVLAAHDPVVARALSYMWAHLSTAISVNDVANAVGVSRRKLERAFRDDLGRGVNQELLRRRVERSCELLCSSDLTIADLAPKLGFGSKDYFQRVFRNAMGTSPGKWRREWSHTQPWLRRGKPAGGQRRRG